MHGWIKCVSGCRLQIIFSGLSRFQGFFSIIYKLLPFDSSPSFHDICRVGPLNSLLSNSKVVPPHQSLLLPPPSFPQVPKDRHLAPPALLAVREDNKSLSLSQRSHARPHQQRACLATAQMATPLHQPLSSWLQRHREWWTLPPLYRWEGGEILIWHSWS